MSKPTVNGKVEEPFVIGGKVRQHTKIISGPLSYTTSGDALPSSDFSDTWFLSVPPAISTDGTRIAYFYPANGDAALHKSIKMLIVDVTTGAEVANASDQTTKKFVVVAQMVG